MAQQVLITGGKGDLARHIRHTFLQAGDLVAAPGRDELDVTRSDSVGAWIDAHPLPDLLVAQAGCAESQLLHRTDEASWDRQMEANLHGVFRCIRAVAPRMVAAGKTGHFILISSHAARHPTPGQAAYGAAKAGLIGMAHSLARELGCHGIRVNALLPGFLETRMTSELAETQHSAVRAEHCLGRFNTPDATADFILHLHRNLPHTSGQVFQLDSRPG